MPRPPVPFPLAAVLLASCAGLDGPFGPIEMGGMFSVVKVRKNLASCADHGWYQHPPRTVAWKGRRGMRHAA